MLCLEQVQDAPPARMATAPIADALDCRDVEQTDTVRLVERVPDLPWTQELRQVEERASDAGDRDPVTCSPVVGMQVADVVQVDPAVHCMMQVTSASLASVAALDLTITSDSCTRIREHMQLGCRRMRPQLRSCVPATTWVVAIIIKIVRAVSPRPVAPVTHPRRSHIRLVL